jgi:fatty-acyl-CoA synthase
MHPLLIKGLLERGVAVSPKKEIFSKGLDKDWRYTYTDFYNRVCRLANVLKDFGVERGDRFASFAWNNHRHLELYFAPCTGAVLHTLNIRLFREHLVYCINHAEDKVIFIDEDLVPAIEAIKDELKTVKHYVIMTDKEKLPETKLSPAYSYEELLSKASPSYTVPDDVDENSPAVMAYTTGTTGWPKGLFYTHRMQVTHAWCFAMADTVAISEKDICMPVVPMFHANAWGIPYAATFMGSGQVFPGPHPDPRVYADLIQREKVTFTAGMPLIWAAVLELKRKEGYDLSSLRATVSGGSASPRALIEGWEKEVGPYTHGYGMTETTPVITLCIPKKHLLDLPEDKYYDLKAKQGLIAPGLDWRVVNINGEEVKHDGKEMGELLVRGPWIIEEYYKDPERSAEAFEEGRWFHTGDIVTADEEGYIAFVDRTKDVIKSGGEWISSLDLENMIMGHPKVMEATVFAMPHPKWDERPVAWVMPKADYKGKLTKEEIMSFLEEKVAAGKIAKFWLPDEVLIVDEIPKTSIGKFDKKVMREKYREK